MSKGWWRRREPPGCRACGICCELYGHALRASAEDLARWRAGGRQDLLAGVGKGGVLWCDPTTGEALAECPHLSRLPDGTARCAVHETKPAICRAYPTPVHGRRCVRGVVVG